VAVDPVGEVGFVPVLIQKVINTRVGNGQRGGRIPFKEAGQHRVLAEAGPKVGVGFIRVVREVGFVPVGRPRIRGPR
jgi:hypothetical protein